MLATKELKIACYYGDIILANVTFENGSALMLLSKVSNSQKFTYQHKKDVSALSEKCS